MPSDIPSIAKPIRAPAFLGAVLLGATVLRVAVALRRPLQVDEGYSLHLAALPVKAGLSAVATLDVHPPLFLLVTHALHSVGVADVGMRIIMAALGVAAVGMFYGIVRAWHGEHVALVAAAFAAFMPSLIFYDSMIRMYAPFDAFAVATFLLLSFLYTRKDLTVAQRRALWCGWALACGAMIQTLYLGFFVIAAQLAYAALMRRDGLARSLVGAAIACLAWLPQLPTFLNQLPRGGLAFPFYAQHQLAALFELPGQATIAVQTHGAGLVVVLASIFAWAWIAISVAAGLRGNGASLALWMGVPALVTLAYSAIAHKLLYTDRYYLLFAYALCALTGVALARAAEKRIALGVGCGVVAGAIVGVLGCAYAFDDRLYTADWPGVAQLLGERTQPRDLIVMEQGSPFFVLERGPVLGRHPLVLVFHRGQVGPTLNLVKPFRRVWLLLFQSGPVDPNDDMVVGLEKRYRLAGLWAFERWLPAENASVVLFEER